MGREGFERGRFQADCLPRHPLGSLRLHIRGMAHQPLGERPRAVCRQGIEIYHAGRPGPAGPDGKGKCQEIFPIEP